MRLWPFGLLVCVGCTAKQEAATGVTSAVSAAACNATDNTLRFDCTATLDTAAPTTWTVKDGDTVVRTFSVAASATPALTLWGLAPETSYTWEVDAGADPAGGTFATGALPSDLDQLAITVDGTSSVDGVLMSQDCDGQEYLVIGGTDGRVRWYQAIDASTSGNPFPMGYTLTDTGSVVYVVGETVGEVTMAGETILSATGFDRPVHHAVFRAGDRVYVLNAADHDGKVVDGFYVLDETGAVLASWDLADHVTVTGTGTDDNLWSTEFPGALDWSHANSVWSDGDTMLISYRLQNAVMEVVADPDAADFGAIDWTLTGGDSDLPSDYTWSDDGGFHNQHAVWPTDDGLVLFDNGKNNATSRALRLVVDDAAATVHEGTAWSMGQYCDNEGSAYVLANGGMLATCATADYVAEFGAKGNTPVWSMTATCGGGAPGAGPPAGGGGLSRGIPITLE